MDRLFNGASEIVDSHVVDQVLQPLARAIAMESPAQRRGYAGCSGSSGRIDLSGLLGLIGRSYLASKLRWNSRSAHLFTQGAP